MFICICILVNVTVGTEPSDATIFTTSAYVDLVCDHDIASSDGFDISFTWTGPNGIVSNESDYTITDQIDNSTLRIERLNFVRDYNAMYTCLVTAVLDNVTVQGNNGITLRVQGIQFKPFVFTVL